MHSTQSDLFKTLLNFILPFTLPSRFPDQNRVSIHLSYPTTKATCPAHHIRLDLTTSSTNNRPQKYPSSDLYNITFNMIHPVVLYQYIIIKVRQ